MNKGMIVTALAAAAMSGAILGFTAVRAPAAAPVPAAAEPTTFTADPVHSSVVFRINHVGVTPFYGRFNAVEGEFALDAANPDAGAISLTVDAASVDTNNGKRDEHLRSAAFFNVEQFPEIEFTSTSIAGGADGEFTVTGDLTLHGVTKSITVDVVKTGEKDVGGNFGYRAGFETRFTIQRSDFDMTFMIDNGLLGDEVELTVAIEGVRK